MSDSKQSYDDGRAGRSSVNTPDWSAYQAGRAEKDAWDKHRAAMSSAGTGCWNPCACGRVPNDRRNNGKGG